MKKIFFSKGSDYNPFEIISTDIHSHLIPGIDDGSKSIEQSLEMARGLVELGFKKAITTPHVIWDYYPNTPESIQNGLDLLKLEIKRNNIPIKIETAFEYMVDYEFKEKISKNKLLTFGDNYLLFELSFLEPPDFFSEVTFNLHIEGFKLVFAHPERYEYYLRDFKQYEDLKAKEIYFQINFGSLSGIYGHQIKKNTEKLISEGMVEFIGSDLHSPLQIENLKSLKNNKYIKKLIDSGNLLNQSL